MLGRDYTKVGGLSNLPTQLYSPQLFDMLLQIALRNLDPVRCVYQPHLFVRQPQAQVLERVFGRRSVTQFLFPILHVEEIEMMRIVETAHALINCPA